jgi:GTP 3',8-cyclase
MSADPRHATSAAPTVTAPTVTAPTVTAAQTSARGALPLLVDRFGRVHRSLRISVTDRCNIRCQYCMPAAGAEFLPSDRLLSFDQIVRFVDAVTCLGIREVRITGGEPLMRPGLDELIGRLRGIAALDEIALTTNGMLLPPQIDSLVSAGLQRINISLDTLNEAVFKRLSRRAGLEQVLAGIAAARRYPQLEVRLNALVMRDVNFAEVTELVAFAREQELSLRFIEFMPLDAERAWSKQQMVSGAELRAHLSAHFGPLQPLPRADASQPAVDYCFADGRGRIGFIDSVTQPFCGACDRLRLTADGKIRNCLFGSEEWDVKPWLAPCPDRTLGDEVTLLEQVRACIRAKRAAHGIDGSDFAPPARAMFQIGG